MKALRIACRIGLGVFVLLVAYESIHGEVVDYMWVYSLSNMPEQQAHEMAKQRVSQEILVLRGTSLASLITIDEVDYFTQVLVERSRVTVAPRKIWLTMILLEGRKGKKPVGKVT